MNFRKVIVFFRTIIIVFCFLSIWGWMILHTYDGHSKFGIFGSVALSTAEFPRLVKSTFSENFGFKNPLLLDNSFPEIQSLDDLQVENDSLFLFYASYTKDYRQSTIKLLHLSTKKVINEWVLDYGELFNRLDKSSIDILDELGNLNSQRNGLDPLDARSQHLVLNNDFSIVFSLKGPVICLDSLSNIKWVVGGDFHHSIEKDHEGNYWVPGTDHNGKYAMDLGIRDDILCKISPNGEVLLKKSVMDIMVENGYRGYVFGDPVELDPIHLNDIQPVIFDSKFWKKGDVFVSFKTGSSIFLYRPVTNKVIWLKRGPWLNQHDVDILDSSRVSVFGNDILRKDRARRGDFPEFYLSKSNNIYIYDLAMDEITEPYAQIMDSLNIQTPTQGLAEIQPNGKVYIEETDRGRYLLVDSVSVKWQFVDRSVEGKVKYAQWSRLLRKTNEGKFID